MQMKSDNNSTIEIDVTARKPSLVPNLVQLQASTDLFSDLVVCLYRYIMITVLNQKFDPRKASVCTLSKGFNMRDPATTDHIWLICIRPMQPWCMMRSARLACICHGVLENGMP